MNVRSFKPGSKVKRAIGLGIAALALTAVNTTGAHAAGGEAETGCRSQNLVLIGQVRMYDNSAYSTRIGTVEQWYDQDCYAVFARYQSFNQPFTSNIGVAIYDPDGSYHITFLYNQPPQNFGGPIESPHVWIGHWRSWTSNKWFHARADITNTARGCHMTGDTANHDYSTGGVSGSDWISPGC
ncbi:hypothetical protein [Streptomyces sp. CBMA152]|uniref:hypothetical protein n=1 Tax=Streptomyces sp. CBMA152 TaxID=1896312 RepID=UPI0016610BA6|nr:hypothetical protein [Streptomyces sp. CBMA152]MBD0746104.1 hypothetical protein [Streptomyces sp. CBMA152]